MGGIEWRGVAQEIFCDSKVVGFDAFDDAFRKFVGAVGIEVRIVFEFHGLARESVGRILNEGFGGFVGAHGLIENFAHGVQIDQRHVFFAGELAHGIRIIAQSVDDFSVGAEAAAIHRSDENRRGAAQPRFIDIEAQVGFVIGCGVDVIGAGFLIVVRELDEEIVARLHGAENFREAIFGDKSLEGLTRFSLIGD